MHGFEGGPRGGRGGAAGPWEATATPRGHRAAPRGPRSSPQPDCGTMWSFSNNKFSLQLMQQQ